MKKALLIFLSICVSINSEACNCRGTSDYFNFFKNEKNLFVGRVKSISKNKKYTIYEFTVINKLRGNFNSTELIYSTRNTTCELYVQIDSVYLIQVHKIGTKWHSGLCSFHVRKGAKAFESVFTLINAFMEKKDIFLRSVIGEEYFIGRIQHGERIGHWISFSNDTNYISSQASFHNGKKVRKWALEGTEESYRDGKFIGMSEIISDGLTVQVITTTRQRIIYYLNGKIYKLMKGTKYRVYYPNGAIKEKATIIDGALKGSWIKYDEEGKVIERIGEQEGHLFTDFEFYKTIQKADTRK